MGDRIDLHNLLIELLGNSNVYYQPPSNINMQYPCIKYKRIDIKSTFANNTLYKKEKLYEIIVIDKKPDNEVIDALLTLPYSSYIRPYISDNLNHDVLEIYY